MQANVLTAFIGNRQEKIKVFPTRKDVKPFRLDSKMLRRAFPFLVASAMVFTACSDGKEQKSENKDIKKDTTEVKAQTPEVTLEQVKWGKIYQQVVKQYGLDGLHDKIPLSVQEINELINTPQDVVPNDSNFNHLPASQENFWEIVKGGIAVVQDIQKDSTLSENIKQMYQQKTIEALSKINKAKWNNKEVDLNSYNTLHAFIFFEKLLKYQDDFEMIFYNKAGWIDEQKEFFGRYYQDHLDFEEQAKNYPGIELFAKALYANTERFIVEAKDSAYANALSNKMFEEWRCAQNISEENVCAYTDAEKSSYVNTTVYNNKRGYLVGISLDIDPKGQIETPDGLDYLPVGLIKIHEMQHILALAAKSYERPEHNYIASEKSEPNDLQGLNDNYVELGPTLYTLVYSDRVYKAINKIDRDSEVDYGVNIQVSNNSVPLGKIANWFGKMMEKYPSKSVDKILQKKEVLEQINAWGIDKHELPLMNMNNFEVSR